MDVVCSGNGLVKLTVNLDGFAPYHSFVVVTEVTSVNAKIIARTITQITPENFYKNMCTY